MKIIDLFNKLKKSFNDKIDQAYIRILFPNNHPFSWFLHDVIKNTPNKETWKTFKIDYEYNIVMKGKENIATLSEDLNSVILFNRNFNALLNLDYPEKFLDLSNHILQVAYFSAYYYPVVQKNSNMLNDSFNQIKKNKGRIHSVYKFNNHDFSLSEDSLKSCHLDSSVLILKKKGTSDIFIQRISVRSIYTYQYAVLYIGFDTEHLYYNFNEKESLNPFNICPINYNDIMSKFKIISKDELFKSVCTDIIGFVLEQKQENIPTYYDKLLFDMIRY